jgi:uncharacterized membrane protein
MTEVKKQILSILADSVSNVLGSDNLVYIAVKRAATDDNSKNYQWAESAFNQVSPPNRRNIRKTAVDKAEEERRATKRAKKDAANAVGAIAPSPLRKGIGAKAGPNAEVVDMRKLFGG